MAVGISRRKSRLYIIKIIIKKSFAKRPKK